ncbi:MAG TPA: hypothetical protein V6D47_08910 [Oscillatoriaceae cyanobacterium]
MSALELLPLAEAAVLGLLTGAIAWRKGYHPVVWWACGTGAFVLALPMLLWLKPRRSLGGKPLPVWARVAVGLCVTGLVLGSWYGY